MPSFADLLRGLLTEGSVRLRQPPRPTPQDAPEALELLRAAFRDARLDVAGPPLDFAPTAALRAAEFVAWSCWLLLHREEPDDAVHRALAPPPAATSAADHLAADLTLRFLPTVHRRARAVNPRDVLTLRLEEVLRGWPLSGVLADLPEPPTADVELGGHPGLLLLYAERLAERNSPAWVAPGPARAYIELVFSERGLALPPGVRSEL